MTRLAPLITGFLRDYMPTQRGYSPHSCETYAHSFKLLFAFAAQRTGTKPSQLHIEQLDAALILDFLAHIEKERGNSAVTRNLRLSAIKAFMRYVEYQVPAALEQMAQIRAIPTSAMIRADPASDHGGGARHPERAEPDDTARAAGSGDDAPVLRRRLARLGTGRRHAGQSVALANAEPGRRRKGPEAAKSSALERYRGRPARVARRAWSCPYARTLRQCQGGP